MTRPPRLACLILYVRDLEASRRFYEEVLGLRAIREDHNAVDYSAGEMTLTLQTAADAGVELPDGKDRSVDITFLVEELDPIYQALAARGLRFSRTLEYEVGKTVDFYDPDGHWFSLYEPSAVAMTWPSGAKIAAMRASGGPQPSVPSGLHNHHLVYLFVFVPDPDATLAFYHQRLQLTAIEGGPCRRGVTRLPRGVVKYDAGGTLLTTHAVDEPHAAEHRVRTRGSGAVALVFQVEDLDASVGELADRGIVFTDRPSDGATRRAQFTDPWGYVYHLWQPSAEAVAASRA